ncbi:hypothetical protein NIES4103_49880 [Nostoc sp. NIES-4103]|nr:hypothetical protein NIES4103_49880 [Nostoc sp. NIES-4103]
MSHNTFAQENVAAMTELNDEEITNLVGGTYGYLGYLYDGDLVDLDLNTGDILSNNNVNVLSVAQNVIGLGLLGSGKAFGIF